MDVNYGPPLFVLIYDKSILFENNCVSLHTIPTICVCLLTLALLKFVLGYFNLCWSFSVCIINKRNDLYMVIIKL